MIPVLEKIINFEELAVFQTTDNKFGVGFEILPCDLETDDVIEYQRNLLSFIRSVSVDAIARLKLNVKTDERQLLNCERGRAAAEVGFSNKSVILFAEFQGEPFVVSTLKSIFSQSNETAKAISSLRDIYNQAIQSGLTVKPLSSDETNSYFMSFEKNWIKEDSSVSDGLGHIGIIRMTRPSQDQISEITLAEILKELPTPFEISISWQRKSPGKMRMDLERRLKQTSQSSGASDQLIHNLTLSTLSESIKSGAQFIDYEFLVVVYRDDESDLRKSLGIIKSKLSAFGDFQIETFGAAPSWAATLCGNQSHVTSRELDETFCLQLPVWHLGEKKWVPDSRCALPLLRTDKSVYTFDLFNPEFSVYNSVIVGTSGRGKSVLTGLLSKALLNDPNVHIIKLDVGGSHRKECELFRGEERVLELHKPSGINPFEIVNFDCSDSEKVGILSKFLGVLIQEQGEISFSKDLRAQVEESIQSYLYRFGKEFEARGDDDITRPSLQSFYEMSPSFPRRNLLKRWVKGGVYEAAFAVDKDSASSNKSCFSDSSCPRLFYYNFSQIFQASEPEFAQAGLAAVLAQFNMETLRADGKRIVLICDETPFFIKNCFEFFKFSTANVRKFGHAVILVTQLSSDLVVNGDAGIIENSPQRFLFSVDGDEGEYQSRFNLKPFQVEVIKGLRSVPGESSEVFLQTATSGRKLQIKVTKKEYWELTSSRGDNEKLQKLRDAVPGLSLTEAIKCLSAI